MVVVVNDEAKRSSIAVSQRTKDALDSIKHPGQTYDGVIQELITFWKGVREPESISKPLRVRGGGPETK